LQLARLLVFVLLLAVVIAPALAQNQLPGNQSSVDQSFSDQLSEKMLDEVNAEINSAVAPVAAPVSLPNTPLPQRAKVIDKKFIAVMAALGGAETLRFTTHKLVLDHEFAAGAPWVTSVPANPHLVAKYAAIYAAELLLAYELKKPHSWLPGDRYIKKLWWVYPAVMTPIHIKNGVRSIRTQSPSCPPDECQLQ
jgi:hypothetical protein